MQLIKYKFDIDQIYIQVCTIFFLFSVFVLSIGNLRAGIQSSGIIFCSILVLLLTQTFTVASIARFGNHSKQVLFLAVKLLQEFFSLYFIISVIKSLIFIYTILAATPLEASSGTLNVCFFKSLRYLFMLLLSLSNIFLKSIF